MVVMQLQKMVNTFHKDYSKKPTVISTYLNSVLPMAKPTFKLLAKQKQERLAKGATKRVKYGEKVDIQASLILNGARSQQIARNLSF